MLWCTTTSIRDEERKGSLCGAHAICRREESPALPSFASCSYGTVSAVFKKESLKCVVLKEPFPCTPHSPVKPGMRSLLAQTSGPDDLSSRVLVSPLACQKIISLSGAARHHFHTVFLGHSGHARAYLPLVSNNIRYVTSSGNRTLYCHRLSACCPC